MRKNGHKDARLPRFKGKKHFTTMDFNQSGFKIADGKIKLSHSYNNIPLEKEYIDNGLYQAFDLGLSRQTAVNINGKFFEAKNRTVSN